MKGRRWRYELKFRIDAEVKKRLLESLEPGLEFDAHGPSGLYHVRSQYYDTPDFEAYWEKLDGVEIRRKFRLRWYREEGPYFFEIKHRAGQTVWKERVRLVPERARSLLLGELDLVELASCLEGEPDPTSGAIVAAAARQQLRPIHIIGYHRQAWLGRVDPGLRVTFDHRCNVYNPADLEQGAGLPICPTTDIILEVKFNRRLPRWVRQRLVDKGLRPIRFSKYLEGVNARAGLPNRRRWAAVHRLLEVTS